MKLRDVRIECSIDCAPSAEITFVGGAGEAQRLREFIRNDFDIIIDKGYRPAIITYETKRCIDSLLNKRKMKVIFNPPATILLVGDKKYVSKAHNEEFDEEKGLLMCLAKANGITHLELKRMIKGAERQGDKNEKRT